MTKRYLSQNVYDAAVERLDYLFERFAREELYVSFSAGKDSTVLLHMAIDAARRHGKLPLPVMTIDLEASYRGTVELLETMMWSPDVEPYWICLPFGYRNSVSMFQPYWICWDRAERERWVRPMPEGPGVIHEGNNPFAPYGWFRGMRPSQFYKVFARYIANRPGGTGTAVSLVGIRSDESLNRWRVLYANKTRMDDAHNWTTLLGAGDEDDDSPTESGLWNTYPIYDWGVEDVWAYIGRTGRPYNRTYDRMYLAGRSIHRMRICQPFGDEQKAGLDLYREIEPETWARVVERVSGANAGALYCGSTFAGTGRITKPPGHTWKSYYELIMESLPSSLRDHYARMVEVTVGNWTKKGKVTGRDGIDPDYGDLTPGAPSYMRFCKMILRNDFMGHTLKFGGRKYEYLNYAAGEHRNRKRAAPLDLDGEARDRAEALKEKYGDL